MKFLYNFETRSRLMNFQKPYFFTSFRKIPEIMRFFPEFFQK